MLQGRWRSLAFLDYIRPQVDEFGAGLSTLMTNVKEFYTVPESNYNTYYNLKENTHDFHPTQHMFVPEQTRRYPTADSALPPQNGLRSDQVEPHCLVRHYEFLHCV